MYKVVKRELKRKGFPTATREYKTAHEEADVAEKRKFPKGYNKLKHPDAKLPKGELVGKNTRNGKIEVSSKVPDKLRKEVAYHERMEHKNIKRLKHNGK